MSKPNSADDLVQRIKRQLHQNSQGDSPLSALKSPAGAQAPAGQAPPSSVLSPSSSVPANDRQRCLLLDVSGSMSEHVEPGRSKWDALRGLLPQFALLRMFAFSGGCAECRASTLPPPETNTDMAGAFYHLKGRGIRHAVLITDGLPDDERAALAAVAGLRLDIFYVGPHPRPPFLDRLAAAAGGSAQTASLKSQGAPRLAAAVRSMLALPPGNSSPGSPRGEE